jgi:hypothetical protein
VRAEVAHSVCAMALGNNTCCLPCARTRTFVATVTGDLEGGCGSQRCEETQ